MSKPLFETRRQQRAKNVAKKRLAPFKVYVWTYWDLVPNMSHRLREDSLHGLKPSQLLEEVIFLVSGPYDPSKAWDTLYELRRAAWVPNLAWNVPGQPGQRPMSKTEFWEAFEAKIASALTFRPDLW